MVREGSRIMDGSSHQAERQLAALVNGKLTRRGLIQRAAALGLSASAVAGFLAACGSTATPNPGAPAGATSAPPTTAPTSASASGAGAATAPSGSGAASPTMASSGSGAASSPAASPAAGASPAASANPNPVPVPAGKTDLNIAAGADISVLNPQLSTSANDTNISFNIFDNMIYRDASNTLKPGLALEWKAVDDTTWEFKLRPNVKWHDGSPFTSADVKFTLDRASDPAAKTLVSAVFTTVASIETPDPLTVRCKTKAPDALLAARQASYGGQIMPKDYFTKVGPDEFNKKPVGTGPYKFVEWVKDDRVVLEANADYWGGAPAAAKAIWRPRPEVAARVSSLLSGEADLNDNVPPDQIDTIDKSGKARVVPALFAGLYVVAVNSKIPVLSKPEVKQAMAYAIDRKTIIDTMWKGLGLVPNGLISKGSFAYDEKMPPIPYDPAKSKDLLKKAGYNNEEVIFETTQGYIANDKQMTEAITQMWQAVGLNAKISVIETSVRAQKNRDKSFLGVWWSDPTDTVGDPAGMMWRLLGPGGIQDYWRNARWDELGKEANSILDQNKRRQDYEEMNKIGLLEFPWIPVMQPYRTYGLANYVNWTPYGNTYFNLRKDNFSFVK